MFILNDDNSIYVTRGDAVFFTVMAKEDEGNYLFKKGDVVRFKVYGKKDAENVVLQKDFYVEADTETIDIILTKSETKIGDVISKPRDYWYEVELNPFDNPQTIVGYDEDGAKIFKLFPEGEDLTTDIEEEEIPVVDDELSLTSDRPIQNQAVTRAIINLVNSKEAIERGYVTPEMFGAVGDGVADDTEAIINAINTNNYVFFPNGTYLVTSTINIDKPITLKGVNSNETKIKYTGEGYLFNISTDVLNRAIIENIYFIGSDNSFIKCDKGAWGSSFILRDFNILGFNDDIVHFVSSANCFISHGRILSNGKFKFTYEESKDKSLTFSNDNVFDNVYYTGYPNKTVTLFDLSNVRCLFLNESQFENIGLLFSNKASTQKVRVGNCWIEGCDYIYETDGTSQGVLDENSHYVNVIKHNKNNNIIDYKYDGGFVSVVDESYSNSVKAIDEGEEQVFFRRYCDNKHKTAGSEDFYMYNLTSKKANFEVPLNMSTKVVTNTDNISFNLSSVHKYLDFSGLFHFTIAFEFDDGSVHSITFDSLFLNTSTYYLGECKDLYHHPWGTANTSTITRAKSEQTITFTASSSCKQITLFVEYNLCRRLR